MAPPSTKLKLSQIDPDELAAKVEHDVVRHVKQLYLMVFGQELPEARTELSGVVRAVAKYARGDMDAADELDELHGRLLLLLDALPDDPYQDPETPLGLVMMAAQTRDWLGKEGHNVTAAQLGVLAGLSSRQIGELIRTQQIKGLLSEREGAGAAGYIVLNAEAKRWLAERGVPGFAQG
jgi:hypothetical protein